MWNVDEPKLSSPSWSNWAPLDFGGLNATDFYARDGSVCGFSFSNQVGLAGDGHFDLQLAHTLISPWNFYDSCPSQEGMAGSGNPLFTTTQGEELESQRIVHDYTIPSSDAAVPPQLLLPNSLSPDSQSNTTLYASDPEPWRCKRTDGKKWRCSRDVAAPDHKYCHRHAHKPKPPSRKLVDISSHKHPSHAASITRAQFPSMAPAAAYYQTRDIERFMGSNAAAVSNSQGMQTTPSAMELNTGGNKNALQSLNTYNIPEIPSSFQTITSEKTTPSSPLSLTISTDQNSDSMNSDYWEIDGISQLPQWTDPVAVPGGPLGEALYLGNATAPSGWEWALWPW